VACQVVVVPAFSVQSRAALATAPDALKNCGGSAGASAPLF